MYPFPAKEALGGFAVSHTAPETLRTRAQVHFPQALSPHAPAGKTELLPPSKPTDKLDGRRAGSSRRIARVGDHATSLDASVPVDSSGDSAFLREIRPSPPAGSI